MKKGALFVLVLVAVAVTALMFHSPKPPVKDSASPEVDQKTNSSEIKYPPAPMDNTNAQSYLQIKSASLTITNGNSISNGLSLKVELFPVVINRLGHYFYTDAGRQNIYLKGGKNGNSLGPRSVFDFDVFHIPKPDHGDDKISGMAMVNGKLIITIGSSNYETGIIWQN